MQVGERTATKRYARFIEPGIISYDDVGKGMVFVSRDALDRMAGTLVGKPVVLRHEDPEDGEEFEIGVVSDVFYGKRAADSGREVGEEGWYTCGMMIWDDETNRLIDNEDWSVSCAYAPTEVGSGGSYHGIDYQTEVLDGVYLHMAIVDSPRYEASLIYRNSKGERMGLKLFRKSKSEEPEPEKLENAKGEIENEGEAMSDDAYVEMENGDRVPLSEMMAAYKAQSEDSGTMLNMDDEVDVDGERVPVKMLYDAYVKRNAAENAEAPQDVNAEDVVDEAKQESGLRNSKTEGKKHFDAVKNAASKTVFDPPAIETEDTQFKRGSERYSSARLVQQKGGRA